ncbi:unnamed protein product [Didymodactylos carnosus]|uniref:EGF-like domain-containing protein n=1 Tax=Didymodactylos carnosus TaxID=1234261 RepID=A0A815V5U0_9BILA|nr:unnamed protein product [Didymodactylos carnosus]CAF4383965.1 unnamed protein product [Didymodactylos carnosus]
MSDHVSVTVYRNCSVYDHQHQGGIRVETYQSYECRCYFDYIGENCQERLKQDRALWSSLIPVHTKVLFDMLQKAYHSNKPQRKSSNEINFGSVLSTEHIQMTTTNPLIRNENTRDSRSRSESNDLSTSTTMFLNDLLIFKKYLTEEKKKAHLFK